MDLFSILDTLDNLLLKLPAPPISHVKPVKQGWGVSKTNPEILYLLYFWVWRNILTQYVLPVFRVPLKHGPPIPMPAIIAISTNSSFLGKFVNSSWDLKGGLHINYNTTIQTLSKVGRKYFENWPLNSLIVECLAGFWTQNLEPKLKSYWQDTCRIPGFPELTLH